MLAWPPPPHQGLDHLHIALTRTLPLLTVGNDYGLAPHQGQLHRKGGQEALVSVHARSPDSPAGSGSSFAATAGAARAGPQACVLASAEVQGALRPPPNRRRAAMAGQEALPLTSKLLAGPAVKLLGPGGRCVQLKL